MKLIEGLTELRTNLLRDTSTRVSGNPDYFWSDETLVRYINDAQRRFARRTYCIRDDTTAEICQVVLRATTPVYPLHPSILRVMTARHQDSTQDLVRVTHPITYARLNPYADTVSAMDRSTLYFDINNTPNPGQPKEYSTDEGLQIDDEHQIRMLVRPTPDTAQDGKNIFMRVIRLPLEKLHPSKPNTCFEIPEDWQLDMLEWAAYRALRNYDAAGDEDNLHRAKAQEHKNRFEEAVRECKAEIADKEYQPLTWKFGSAGFGGYIHN